MKEIIIDGIVYVPKQEVKKQEVLRTPDNIIFEKDCYGDKIGIVFNDNKNTLQIFVGGKFVISESCKSDFVKNLPMYKINPEERMVGGTYYMTDKDSMNDSEDKGHYCKYLGDNYYRYILNDEDCNQNNMSWKHI